MDSKLTELAGILLLVILGIFFSGWIAFNLYNWFLLPVGLPKIGYIHFTGIYSLIIYIKSKTTKKHKDEPLEFRYILTSIIFSLTFLLIGFILKELAGL